MKIADAQKIYYANREALVEQKRTLSKQLEVAKKNYELTGNEIFSKDAATLQLSLDATNKAFEENQKVVDDLMEQHTAVFNAEVSKQQADAAEKYGKDLGKIMTVFRRMAHGDIVPSSDERKLLDFDKKMYQAAKNMQAMAQMQEKKHKKHKSLWEEDEEQKEYDPEGKADNTEYAGDLPAIEVPSMEPTIDISVSDDM